MSAFTSRSNLKRFFAGKRLPEERTFALDESLGHYASRVLRLPSGTSVLLFDEEGRAAQFCIQVEKRGTVVVERESEFRSIRNENRAHFSIAVGLSKGGKPDEIVRRITELGAVSFFPLQTTRSLWKGAEARANTSAGSGLPGRQPGSVREFRRRFACSFAG